MALESSDLFERILEALGAKNAPEAARILGISKQAVYDWQKKTPGLDNLVKIAKSRNTSLHWLITGEGEKFAVPPLGVVSLDETIRGVVREIVREEIAASSTHVQQLGTVDEFDLEAAVQKYDNAITVLREWYAHDRVPAPNITALANFGGWENKTLADKVRAVRTYRASIDEDIEFEKLRKASTKARTTK